MAQTANIDGISLSIAVGGVTANLLTRSPFLEQLETDLPDTFFNDFNEPAIFTFKNGTTTTIQVLFDNATTTYKNQAPAEFNTLRPQVVLQESLIPDTIEHMTKIKIQGLEYFIEDYESNGVGLMTIYMRRH